MMDWINEILLGGIVPWILMGAGLFFCLKLRFFHLLHVPSVIRGLLDRRQLRASLGGLSLALAGTLGVGNLVGVASAIVLGGSGAVFWMWVSALCAMLLKYAEIVLAVRHRRVREDGSRHGSASYYILDGLSARGFPGMGKWVATVFAVLCLVNGLTVGSSIQVHSIAEAFEGEWAIPPQVTGILMTVAVFLATRRGTSGILRVTERLVPLMTLGFLAVSLWALVLRADAIPSAIVSILENALRPQAAVGGIGGFLFSSALRYGTLRGLISNEAGCGTAPAAHAAADCQSPARQGLFGIVEVFVDTVLLCTVTALVILVSGAFEGGEGVTDFMGVTLRAYGAILGRPATVFMSLSVLLFGFATVVCWSHYGSESVTFLSRRRWAERGFRIAYLLSVLLGAVLTSGWLWQAADLSIGLMTVINVAMLCMMSGEVKEETRLWLKEKESRKSS